MKKSCCAHPQLHDTFLISMLMLSVRIILLVWLKVCDKLNKFFFHFSSFDNVHTFGDIWTYIHTLMYPFWGEGIVLMPRNCDTLCHKTLTIVTTIIIVTLKDNTIQYSYLVQTHSCAINYDRVEIAFIFSFIYWLKPLTNGRGEQTKVLGENLRQQAQENTTY